MCSCRFLPGNYAKLDTFTPINLLKYLSEQLTAAITALFRLSVQLGTLLNAQKQEWIPHIFMGVDCNDPANYRHVALICISCKCLEHILSTHVKRHLDLHSILTPANHAFCSKQCCETQLLLTTYDTLKQCDEGKQIYITILDFSKSL